MSFILSQIEEHPHNEILDNMAQLLCAVTQNNDPSFFRSMAAFFLAKMAASMRAKVNTPIWEDSVPANAYVIALAQSGFGKGHSLSILRRMTKNFETRFKEETFPKVAEHNLQLKANRRCAITGATVNDEYQILEKQFRLAGPVPYIFDSATAAAIKQIREKLLLAELGSITLLMDEIGSNIVGNTEALNVFLELFDLGHTGAKLIKNTQENTRFDDLDGPTPANALMIGVPNKLMDSGPTEAAFMTFLDTGYARRSFFAFGTKQEDSKPLSPKERLEAMKARSSKNPTKKIASMFGKLADQGKVNWVSNMDDAVTETLLEYQDSCVERAAQMGEYDEIRRIEMTHRHSKALKLAGIFAFVEESQQVTNDHLLAACKMAEESGLALNKILTREKSYVKLAKYLAETPVEQTHADLDMALPFYSQSKMRRDELMRDASAWGAKNNIIIRKEFRDGGIEFFTGETLQQTDLSQMVLSYSDHMAYNYVDQLAPFDKLHKLTTAKSLHWCNHYFEEGHRQESNAVPGFNMVVLDVDGGVKLDFAKEAFEDTVNLISTTKRHTKVDHRYRILLPLKYKLYLTSDDYYNFMEALIMDLPFTVDPSSKQRAKKWLSHPGEHFYNFDGKLLNPLPYIPNTSKNEEYMETMKELGSLDNLERWFAQRITVGNRNNQMIKYALALVDAGMPYTQVEEAVYAFNSKLPNRMSKDEIASTILVTVAKKIHAK